jgi:DNA-directed RNA polymerase specialized sigma24 family protein
LQQAEAEDLTQAVLIRFLQRSRNFHDEETRRFRGWLRAGAYAPYLDLLRSRGHDPCSNALVPPRSLLTALLVREARRLILDKPFPADGFAH